MFQIVIINFLDVNSRHMDIARTEAEKFMGREDELSRVKEYLLGSRKGAFVVYGPTGSGKTCFISKVATLTGKTLKQY